MKKIFTLISAVFMAVSANAALEPVALFSVAEGNPVDGTEIEGVNCKVQLHTSDLKANAVDATILGAQLNTETKYVQIDFNDALQAGDMVFFSYFVGSNPSADNIEGISVSNLKVDTEGYTELAKLYVQKADQKNVVTAGYVAQGGEKKFIVYKLNNTTMFQAVKVVRGYSSTLDFTNPVLNTQEVAEANITDVANLTITNTQDGEKSVTEWKNTAGQTASFAFTTAPIAVSYKNSSSKSFIKARETGFQFNNTGAFVKIACNVGAKITIVSGVYSKDGGFEVTGGDKATISLPKETATIESFEATAAGVTLKVTGACLIEKIIIENPSTGVISVRAEGAKAKVAGTVNLAGQQVGADYKGIVIKDGKKVMQ